MLIPTAVRDSKIFGKGLFATHPVAKGTILCSFTLGSSLISEAQFLDAIARGVPDITRTGTRYVGRYFTFNATEFREGSHTSFFNHSFNPNALCHCGVVIAVYDITADEELTLDYRTLIDATDVGIYNDAVSGQEIRGFSARDTFLKTAKEFIAIIEGIEDWQR